MEPRPPESKESGRKKSLRKHPHEYDIEQLDLQWLPKVQELCKKTGETKIKTKYGEQTDDVDAAIRLTSTVSKKDDIKGMGEINVRQLKDLLKGMSRKELEKLGISRNHLHQLLQRADRLDTSNKGTITYEQFLETLSKYRLNTEQASRMKQIGTALAYAEEFTCTPPKLFIAFVTILELAVYLYHVIHFGYTSEHTVPITWHGPVPSCSVLIYNPYRRWEAWRYITYMFVHIGISHFVFNMIMQIMIGVFLEMEQSGLKGSFKVCIVYMSGVIAGSIGQSLTEPGIYVAGCSGGVYALIAAHLSTVVLNWNEDNDIQTAKKVIHFGFVKWVRVLFIAVLVIYDTTTQILGHYGVMEGDNNTSVMGHLCGALAGLTVGIFVLDNRKAETWEAYVRWISMSLFLLTLIFGILWNIFANKWMCGDEDPHCLYPEQDWTPLSEPSSKCAHWHV